MLKYHGSNLVRAGFLGAVLIILVILVGLQPEKLLSMATNVRYQALFSEAGGIMPGNDVTVSGMKVGTVQDVSLRDGDALVTFLVKGAVELGSDTTAHIRTGTLLGQRVLTLESDGKGTLKPADVIPVTRTGAPYSLTDSLSEFTANTADTDTAQLNQSLNTLSDTIDRISPQLGPTFDGVSRLSRMLNERNESLGNLLKSASNVTSILGERSQHVNLLANTSALSKHLSGIVADNEKDLAPALEKINAVTAMLERNNDNITAALKGLAKYQITQAEAVNSGFLYNAFVANLSPGQIAQPFFDYALGFRRGIDAGQPPDNAGPRAEIPFPYNGIPQPYERWGQP
jgi:phospholipid/cholesterol/gamma-HCH transport system substrate-binding protein